jgi:hypothetical protein
MDKKNQPQKSSTTDWPDPIAFLTDYKDFAVNARLLLINLIAEKHRKTQNRDEKKLLHTLGLEQIAFFIESLESFFVAVTQKGSVDIYSVEDCDSPGGLSVSFGRKGSGMGLKWDQF